MAANAMNQIEKHVEKIVLGLCALLFLYGVVHWGLSSPTEMEGVPLKDVDGHLKQSADAQLARSHGAKNPVEPIPDYESQMTALQKVSYVARYGPMVELATPHLEPEGVKFEGIERPYLAQLKAFVKPPPAPMVQARIEVVNPGGTLQEAWASHLAVLYPTAEIVQGWAKKMRDQNTLRPTPVILSVEVEAMEKPNGGEWGPPRPVKLSTELEKADLVAAYQKAANTIRQPEKRTATEVITAVSEIAKEELQTLQLRPAYRDVLNNATRTWGTWQGDLILPLLPQLIPPAASQPAEAGGEAPADAATAAGAPPATIAGAAASSSGDVSVAAATNAVQAGLVPSLPNQIAAGKILVWAHETGLKPKTSYKYRVRLELVNPLLGHPAETHKEHQEDAKKTSIDTGWSNWSNEVQMQRPTAFFVTGDNKTAGQGRVAVYTYVLGVPVEGAFWLTAGEPIGGTQSVKVPDPLGVNPPQKRPVDFETGAISVNFDFNRRTVRQDMWTNTVEMLYLDEHGVLQGRLMAADQESEDYRNWVKKVRDALRAGPVASPSPSAAPTRAPAARPGSSSAADRIPGTGDSYGGRPLPKE